MVIFGGSGDLTKRKLIPSLFSLFCEERLPRRFAIVGVGRTRHTDDTYRNLVKTILNKNLSATKAERLTSFLDLVYYESINPAEESDYEQLRDKLQAIDRIIGNKANYLYYLAVPPSLYAKIPLCLKKVGLNMSEGDTGTKRIIVEKPFGYNLDSALELNQIYASVFKEKQIFRIDHFLGKETVQNILALRFSNGILEPLWNRNYIDYVEITAVEDLGVGERGAFYDNVGALRDMVQNHLSQLVALTAIEPPVSFDENHFRDEVLKIYQALRPLSRKDIKQHVVRGQYTASKTRNGDVVAYRDEPHIAADSRTETFVAMKLYIDNWRWQGVPFFIRTGKEMPTKVSEIIIHFKPTPHSLFKSDKYKAVCNRLIIRLQPNEGVVLRLGMKVPGSGYEVKDVSLDFSYDKLGGVPAGDAYARLIEDCMKGDATLFTRSDAVEASWKFFDPIVREWKKDPSIPLYGYPAGTWGPLECQALVGKDNRWSNPCKNLTDTDLYCDL
ncbi:MAG: glucose-6-phosphate dehydrogenase [Bacteroidales bacterium]